jgi:hypothetical protein
MISRESALSDHVALELLTPGDVHLLPAPDDLAAWLCVAARLDAAGFLERVLDEFTAPMISARTNSTIASATTRRRRIVAARFWQPLATRSSQRRGRASARRRTCG